MIRKIIMFVLVWLMAAVPLVLADGPRALKDLTRPDMFQVDQDELYVIQGTTIFVYSLKDFSLLRKFGQEGFGKGELFRAEEWPSRIRVYKDYLLVETRDKLVFFSRDGVPFKDTRKPRESAYFLPVGDHFAGKIYLYDQKSNIQYMRIIICDADLHEIKEIYRQKWFQQYTTKGFQIQWFSDYLNFEVCDDTIFIEKSPMGLSVEAFDGNGNSLYKIDKEYEKVPVTPEDKEAAMNDLRNDEKGRLMIRRMGSWEKVLTVMDVLYPDFKPAIRDIEISNNTIYLRTFRQRDNKDEFIIMDLKGNILRTVYLPLGNQPGIEDKIVGIKYFTFANDRLYYIKQNPQTKVWGLFIEEMK